MDARNQMNSQLEEEIIVNADKRMSAYRKLILLNKQERILNTQLADVRADKLTVIDEIKVLETNNTESLYRQVEMDEG